MKLIQSYRESDNLVDWLQRFVGKVAEIENFREIGASGNPDFENSWANVGGSDATSAFYIDPFKRVHIKGHVDSGASGTVVFTLPEGYRPSETHEFTCYTTSGGGGSVGHSYAVVTSNGELTLYMSGTSTDVSLDTISFRAI